MNSAVNLLLSICCVCLVLTAGDELIVNVRNGLLKGTYMETTTGRRIMGFMGIPYAKPPVGNLRFQPPIAADFWTGIKDATNENHDICYQHYTMQFIMKMYPLKMSEDCLFLNVYTPKIDRNNLLPVMVWIHGGSFNSGFGNQMKFGPGLLLNKDVILVSMNYRLGPFGFLTTGDTLVPGNMGLKDQSLALKWVRENIINFGGDPESITIFGESAGGACTHLQMLSPQNKGLFQGVISQSGNGVAHWGLIQLSKGVNFTEKLAAVLNCTTETSEEMVDCLLARNGGDINDLQKQLVEWDIDPVVTFAPVIEPQHATAFISETPEHILKNKLGSDVPWMTGITTEEGIVRSADILTNPELLQELNDTFLDIAYIIFPGNDYQRNDEIGKRIRKFYFDADEISAQKGKELTDMYTDAYFTYASNKAVSLHKKYSNEPIYNYLFAYQGLFSVSTMFSDVDTYQGVSHGDELIYLFPFFTSKMPNLQLTEEHHKMEETVLTLWTNFAKYRNPTPVGSKIVWKPVESTKNEYLLMNDYDNLIMEKEMFKERVDFWESLEPLFEETSLIKDEL